jgi:hypothetical protein
VSNPIYTREADLNDVIKLRDKKKFESIEQTYHSSASCDLEDINGITYGGITSRFWMLRKHLITVRQNDPDIPFYSWQCVTLNVVNRDVDLIIANEVDMNDFLMLISHFINTVNNFRGTKADIIRQLQNQKEPKLRKQLLS